MLRQSQLPPFERTHCEVIGGDGPDAAHMATTAICRLIADHPDQQGAQFLVQEQSSAISHMSVGISISLAASSRPIQRIAGFLVPRSIVSQRVTVDGSQVSFTVRSEGTSHSDQALPPAMPLLPDDIDPALSVPLIRLAWARSGDKGNLFNVAVIARKPEYLPYIAAALSEQGVGKHYARALAMDSAPEVERARIFRVELCRGQFNGRRHSGFDVDRLRGQGQGADAAQLSGASERRLAPVAR